MPEIGERLDLDFSLKAVIDGCLWEGRFSELVVKPMIVSVYMRNNTRSCDQQICQLRDVSRQLERREVGVIAVSRDTVGSHKRYASKMAIPFALVSDPEYRFAQATDSLVEKKLYGRRYVGPTRSAYLIDKEGILRGVIAKVDAANHAQQLLELLG